MMIKRFEHSTLVNNKAVPSCSKLFPAYSVNIHFMLNKRPIRLLNARVQKLLQYYTCTCEKHLKTSYVILMKHVPTEKYLTRLSLTKVTIRRKIRRYTECLEHTLHA